jgi:hypothetical protein
MALWSTVERLEDIREELVIAIPPCGARGWAG